VGRRPGVDLDIEVVLEALEVTGVALEINGALDRLDATAEVARLAMARDIDFVIDTDSHHTTDLVRMDYGVSYAQRGWVTSDRVANAKPLKQFLSWAAKRR
jgi:DNA polymerase (family 10)